MATSVIDYTPPPTVRGFIRHHREGELFYDWIIGPVGSGKTTGIFFKLVRMAKLQAPNPKDGIRRTRAVIVRNTFPQLRDTTLASWFTWFKDGEAGQYKSSEMKFTLRFDDVECEVLFRALDTPADVARVLSLEVTFVIFDEFVQIHKEIMEGASGRAGRYPSRKDGGATNWGVWGASNPGNQNDWWHPYLFDADTWDEDRTSDDNVGVYVQPSGMSPDAENLENLPGGAGYYTNLAKGKTERWVKQFIEVKWGYSMTGKPVFPQFKRELHVSKTPLKPIRGLPLVAGYDPGMQSAMVIGQMDRAGRLLILREIVLQDVGTERMIRDHLKPMLMREFEGFEFLVVPDPAAANRGQSDEKSCVDVLKRAGLAVKLDSDNTILPRLEAMEYFLTRITDEGPALQVDPSCHRVIRALDGGYKYTFVEKDGKRRDIPDKNEHSHPADGATYLAKYFKRGIERAGRTVGRPFKPPVFRNSYVV